MPGAGIGARLLTCVVLLVVGSVLAASPTTADEGQKASVATMPSTGSASSGTATKGRLVATFKDGRLTVMAQGLSLERVLDTISREARVAILAAEGVGGQPVSAAFQDVPLEEGLRRILKDYDAFFFYGAERDAPASLRAVWVYLRGQGRGWAPVPPKQWASTKELAEILGDPDPQVRAHAYGALIQRNRGHALDLVLNALRDGDERVRANSLFYALRSGIELPAATLEQLALNDASPNVRFLGLEALTNHDNPNLRVIAERALNDPDPNVQGKAREILGRLGATARSARPKQPAKQSQLASDPE